MGNTVGGGQGGDDIPSALIMGDVVYFIHDSIQENKRSQVSGVFYFGLGRVKISGRKGGLPGCSCIPLAGST